MGLIQQNFVLLTVAWKLFHVLTAFNCFILISTVAICYWPHKCCVAYPLFIILLPLLNTSWSPLCCSLTSEKQTGSLLLHHDTSFFSSRQNRWCLMLMWGVERTAASGRSKHPQDLLQDPSDMQDCSPAQYKGNSLPLDHLPGYLSVTAPFLSEATFQWLWCMTVSPMVRDVIHSIHLYAWKIRWVCKKTIQRN